MVSSLVTTAAPRGNGLPGCRTSCGIVSVPYPLEHSASTPTAPSRASNLTCDDNAHNPPRLLLSKGSADLRVTNIHLDNATIYVASGAVLNQRYLQPRANGKHRRGTSPLATGSPGASPGAVLPLIPPQQVDHSGMQHPGQAVREHRPPASSPAARPCARWRCAGTRRSSGSPSRVTSAAGAAAMAAARPRSLSSTRCTMSSSRG